MKDVASRIEEAARAGLMHEIQPLLKELDRAFERLKKDSLLRDF